MKTKNNIDPLIEWAVWAHLDRITDLELILLKGHLLLDNIIDITLERNNIAGYKNYSFFRKVKILEQIDFQNSKQKDFIISSLLTLNRLRNKIAHEFHFDIENGEFELWSLEILKNLEGTKFTTYIFRTKIVHAFSIISKSLLELIK